MSKTPKVGSEQPIRQKYDERSDYSGSSSEDVRVYPVKSRKSHVSTQGSVNGTEPTDQDIPLEERSPRRKSKSRSKRKGKSKRSRSRSRRRKR